MSIKKSYRPYRTGISFHPVVKRYLDQLCDEEGLTRSDMITRVVKFYAAQHGTPLDLTAVDDEQGSLKKVA